MTPTVDQQSLAQCTVVVRLNVYCENLPFVISKGLRWKSAFDVLEQLYCLLLRRLGQSHYDVDIEINILY